jgi:cation transport regulator
MTNASREGQSAKGETTMPYQKTDELPESVRDNLPKHAQKIYQAAFNSAWAQYDEPKERRDDASREEVAHRVAWAAVKKSYTKNERGEWVKQEDSR